MKIYRIALRLIAPLILLTLAIAPDTAHAQFRFTKIADTAGRFATVSAPALNDAGKVAFEASSAQTFATGIFVGAGRAVTTVADTSGRFDFFGFPAIDNRGEVAFFAFLKDGTDGIFAGTGGSRTLADTSGPIADFVDPSGAPGGRFTTVPVVLKNGGTAIMVSDGAALTTIADTSDLFSALDDQPRVNAAGQVAFDGFLRGGGAGVFVGAGDALTRIADTNGAFRDFAEAPSLNDRGAVAFGANLKAGSGGSNSQRQ